MARTLSSLALAPITRIFAARPSSPRRSSLAAVLLFLAAFLAAGERGHCQFKELGLEYQRGNPLFTAAFRDIVTVSSKSTVRVLCDGRETALGMIVAADGWILTKAHDLHGYISCRLRDGRVGDARITGIHQGHDLAMLQIPLRGLPPVEFADSKSLSVGNWIVCPGISDEPVAVGIVSVATRTRAARFINDDAGFLGVSVEDVEGTVRITQVVPDSAAAKIGLRLQDVIVSMQKKNVVQTEDFQNMMNEQRVGDVIRLTIRRDRELLPLQVTLGRRPTNTVSDLQNHMGSDLSSRRSGYMSILQHDAVLRPKDCGGPLVDLDGRVVGMNVSRAGRTETWAIPTEVIQPLLDDLMSGRMVPLNTLPVRLK